MEEILHQLTWAISNDLQVYYNSISAGILPSTVVHHENHRYFLVCRSLVQRPTTYQKYPLDTWAEIAYYPMGMRHRFGPESTANPGILRYRSGLVPSVADCFRKCMTNLQPCTRMTLDS